MIDEESNKHYTGNLGSLPPAIEQMFLLDATWAKNYTANRVHLLEDREDGLDRKYKHLLLATMDILIDQMGGVRNHIAAAKRAGLTKQEFADTLMCLLLVHGVSAWGKTGTPAWAAWDEFGD